MKASERRRQILQCAAECFAERGYHATTVDDIVSAAHVARGTFYNYFKDKRSIFDELLDAFIADIDARIIRIDPALGLEKSLHLTRRNIDVVFDVCLTQRELTKILLSTAVGLDAEFDQKLLDFDRRVTDLIESSLALGREMGVVREGDLELAALLVYGGLKEVLYQVIMRDLPYDTDRMVDAFLALLSVGVLQLRV